MYREISVKSISVLSFILEILVTIDSNCSTCWFTWYTTGWQCWGNSFYPLLIFLGRNSGSLKIFPCNVQPRRWIGFLPTLFNFIQLILSNHLTGDHYIITKPFIICCKSIAILHSSNSVGNSSMQSYSFKKLTWMGSGRNTFTHIALTVSLV